ncbi:galactokinase, putative [Candida dubliniensis CD36]|uniref:Galactokinase n=1 Tax=Candida dubliniensis (strain CD36 / ATCC MYA-646 / CBS 7987 / NCPF 3949 / NRRL Y-17841) TaxID=573826 RepID=B9W701_CANDC|nr:galactokinase, putative [Candida dubliniensis CD36]CAX44459.1 galactokinase, putative [Candida dubliniensis CD36]
MSVPTFDDLSFYSNDQELTKSRYLKLVEIFQSNFPNASIDFFARSPGRVNLIGDHIDYNFFPVLPMAISNDVIVAVNINDESEIVITNTDSKNFAKETIALTNNNDGFEIDSQHHSWANYFKCALIVANNYLTEQKMNGQLKGMKLTFDGNVPTGGGLSSSAAFCVASTLAILHANGVKDISKADLTRITVVCEHYVGVNTGGMDQCASVYGEPDKALLIQFKPQLIGKPFKFPVENLTFVITNSLQVSNKHETAPIHYNLRVVEMAIAADVLAKKLKLGSLVPQDSNIGTSSLRGVMDAVFNTHRWDGNDIDVGIEQLKKMIDIVETLLNNNQEGYTIDQCLSLLDLSLDQFKSKYLQAYPVKFDVLKLYQRAKHVYQESLRVLETLKLLSSTQSSSNNTKDDEESFLIKFGELMNQSQSDLDKLNESSNEKLNEICSIALQNGSYGSRITGAGWGGSIVHLTTLDKSKQLIQGLIENYYQLEFPDIKLDELMNDAIIDSKPSMGSCIVTTKFLQ